MYACRALFANLLGFIAAKQKGRKFDPTLALARPAKRSVLALQSPFHRRLELRRRFSSLKVQDDGEVAEGSLDPLEEPAEVGCRAVQRHGVEQFEAAGKGVLEGVGRPRSNLLIRRSPPVPPHFPCEVLGGVELVFDERLEDGKPCLVVRDLDLLPCGNLDLHRLESQSAESP